MIKIESPTVVDKNVIPNGVVNDNSDSDAEAAERRAEGVASLKGKLMRVVEMIKTTHARIESLEKERGIARQQYSRALDLQMMIRMKKEAAEDGIEKNEKKLKAMEERLLSKQQFVIECRKFTQTEFKTLSAQEEAMARKDHQVKSYRLQVNEKRAECQRMNARKNLLEEKLERLEGKGEMIEGRKDKLRSRLTSDREEEMRKSRNCSDSSDAVSRSDVERAEIEKGLEVTSKRTEAALARINILEAQVRRLEGNINATNIERNRHEAMIKEILISVQN